jgi:NAD(P)-dependent dehydrogenase (short-subunit alcohol dehydrogenase family)
MTPPVAFIIGAGSVVGRSVAIMLREKGFRVAVGSRHPDSEQAKRDGLLPITVDVTHPEAVESAFGTVREELGSPASVIVYNGTYHLTSIAAFLNLAMSFSASTWVQAPTSGDPLSLPAPDFVSSATVGLGAFAAAQNAISSFRSLAVGEASLPKLFIITGNISPFRPPSANITAPQLQKKLGAHLVELFASRYSSEGFRFVTYTTSLSSISNSVPLGSIMPLKYRALVGFPERISVDQLTLMPIGDLFRIPNNFHGIRGM